MGFLELGQGGKTKEEHLPEAQGNKEDLAQRHGGITTEFYGKVHLYYSLNS